MLVNSLSTTTASNAPIALPRTPERYGEPADWHTDSARDLGDRKVGLGYLTGPSVVRNAAGALLNDVHGICWPAPDSADRVGDALRVGGVDGALRWQIRIAEALCLRFRCGGKGACGCRSQKAAT
jgi:hypothetical protein